MKHTEFIARKKNLNLSYSEFAEIIGYTPDAIKKWKNGNIPKWVDIVLSYLEAKIHFQ